MNYYDSQVQIQARVRFACATVIVCAVGIIPAGMGAILGSPLARTISAVAFFAAIAIGATALAIIAVLMRALDRLEREQDQHNPWRSRPRLDQEAG